MCNSIFIGKKTLPKMEDGEEVDIMVKAVYHTDEDGERTLDVTEVDGDPVIGPDETACGHEDMMNEDADGALRIFLIKKRKG